LNDEPQLFRIFHAKTQTFSNYATAVYTFKKKTSIHGLINSVVYLFLLVWI